MKFNHLLIFIKYNRFDIFFLSEFTLSNMRRKREKMICTRSSIEKNRSNVLTRENTQLSYYTQQILLLSTKWKFVSLGLDRMHSIRCIHRFCRRSSHTMRLRHGKIWK